MQDYPVLTCPICNNFSSKLEKKLSVHFEDYHNLHIQDVYDSLQNENTDCHCGCGTKSTWYGWKKGYSKFIRGHNAKIDSSFSNKNVIEKCKQTKNKITNENKNIWNRGLTKQNSAKINEISEKISKTLLENYSSGKNIPWQIGKTKETDKRIEKISKSKIGKKPWNTGLTKQICASLQESSKKIADSYKQRQSGKRLSTSDINERFDSKKFVLLDDCDYKTRKHSKLLAKCLSCGEVQLRTLYSIESGKCFLCAPKESKGQIEVFDFIKSISSETILLSDRSIIAPKEIDIVIPSKKIAIEFNGLYWHSEKYLKKSYHSDKQTFCADAGYKILNIFEDEWKFKKDIIKSMISYRMGLCKQKIGARSCIIKEVPKNERKTFFDQNHIDGDVSAKLSFGLYHKDVLVACLSLRKPNHKKWKDYFEIARFSQKLNINVSGGLSKLISHIMTDERIMTKIGILSYVDTRYGDGAGYTSAGFVKESETRYSFWWTDGIHRFNRFKIRANSGLQKTEKQVAEESNVYKIWGCKQLVFVKQFNN